MLSFKYIPKCLNHWLMGVRWIDSSLFKAACQSQAGWRQSALLAAWWNAISKTGPVNLSHPHRIHLIALSQLLYWVRNEVSRSQKKELLNRRKKFNLCQRLSEAFTFLSTICFHPFRPKETLPGSWRVKRTFSPLAVRH